MQYAPTRVRAKFGGFYTQTFGEEHFGAYAIRPYTDTPKTGPVLGANPCRGTFRGVCFCAPTRVRAKFDGFHISTHDMTRNLPDFRRKPLSQDIWGRMQYAPTRVRAKFGGFHISAHDMTRNLPDFRPKSLAQDILGRMQYAPTRARA